MTMLGCRKVVLQLPSCLLSTNGRAFLVRMLSATLKFIRISHKRFADRIGRKPVILVGITGIAISTICMGLSNSLFGVIFARSLGVCLADRCIQV